MWQGICSNYYPILCALVVSRLSSKGKTPQNPTPETKKLEAIDGKIAPFYWGGYVTSHIYQVRPFCPSSGTHPTGRGDPSRSRAKGGIVMCKYQKSVSHIKIRTSAKLIFFCSSSLG
jgi:hypothetical protein